MPADRLDGRRALLNEVSQQARYLDQSSVAQTLDPYYAPGVADHLRSLGIRYVFVHRDAYQAQGFSLPRDVPGLRYLASYEGGMVDAFLVSDASGS